MTVVDTQEAATPRPGFEIEAPRLQAWLQGQGVAGQGELRLRQFRGGQSNPTYLLEWDDRKAVLRRKPPGALLPSAHAVDREYRVLRALAAEGSVPVPRPLCECADAAVVGTPFYVMDWVPGRVFWNTRFPELSRDERRAAFDAMNATLARLHVLDVQRLGLGDFGRPQGYVQRQLQRWGEQYRRDASAGRIEALDRTLAWLEREPAPPDETALVHGDFRCDNLIFDATAPLVRAVLDWELATLGHPIADFAYHLMMYRLPDTAIPGLAGHDLEALGLPTEEEYVRAYCERTGRRELPRLGWFRVWCAFRIAAIFHGIRGRVVRGTAVSGQAREYARHVETLAEFAWAQARAEGA